MRFAIRLLRYRGRILPWREIDNRPAIVGDLRIEECRDEDLRRNLKVASIWADGNGLQSKALPHLYDVHIVGMSPQAFALTGFERVEAVEYMQSWIVQRCD